MNKKIWIGTICNRDLEVLDQIKKFIKNHYQNKISIISLLKKDNTFSKKYFKKRLKKYAISFLIIKLHSEQSNQAIYNAIRTYIPKIPLLNSLLSVSTCESRNKTFKFLEKNCKKLNIPKTYFSIKEAYDSCFLGNYIIIKFDIHNIPHLSKHNRIIGIAKSPEEFMNLIQNYKPENLFFQEYLGKCDNVYKLYVIGKYIACINTNIYFREQGLSQIELVNIRIPIEKQFKRKIMQLGRKMGMSVFGIDYILTKEGLPSIFDVNVFPSFSNIPEAISLISDYLYNLLSSQQITFNKHVKIKALS